MPTLVVVTLLIVSLGAAACTLERSSSNAMSPTSAGAPSTHSPTPYVVGTWSSQSFVVPTPSSCTNFQWNITAQTTSSIAGTFSASCPGDVIVTGQASGELVNPTTVPVTVTGTAVVPNVGPCPFSISGTGVLDSFGTTLTIPYTGTTCLGPVSGTETLRKASPTPGAPGPTPVPEPPPLPPPTSPDGIDPSQVTFVNNPPDLGNWAQTARITYVQFRSDAMIVDFDRRTGPGAWPNFPFEPGTPPDPAGGGIQYTLGMCFNRGHWYCSAAIQFWQGRDLEAGAAPSSIPTTWYYDGRWAPMNGYLPAQGEMVGMFVVAGNVRNIHDGSLFAVKERSNIVLVPFDRGNGSSFGF